MLRRARVFTPLLHIGRACLVGLALLLPISPAAAHPGWGLVRDATRGVVYYTDLVQVWQIDRRGVRTIAVADVHTHELLLDQRGVLHGEDQEFVGGSRFRVRVWRREVDGRVIHGPWADGGRADAGFVTDGRNARYWASCDAARDRCVIKRRDATGRIDTAAGGHFFARPLNFLTSHPDGSVLVADGADIARLTPGGVTVLHRAVTRDRGRFAIMGMTVTTDGTIWLAAAGDSSVVRIRPDGVRELVERVRRPWIPSAVLPVSDGRYTMEYDGARCRVRFTPVRGPERVYGG
jgi:hypothetical protein